MKEEYYSRKIILEDVFNGSLTEQLLTGRNGPEKINL
jgi:hypothetical protein